MKTYIDNSKFMELVSEIATEFTEQHFYDRTYQKVEGGESFTEEAQDFYNDKYEELEKMLNDTGIHSENDRVCTIREDLQLKRLKIPYTGKKHSGFISGGAEIMYKWEGDDNFYIWINGEWAEAQSIDFDFKEEIPA